MLKILIKERPGSRSLRESVARLSPGQFLLRTLCSASNATVFMDMAEVEPVRDPAGIGWGLTSYWICHTRASLKLVFGYMIIFVRLGDELSISILN